MSIPTTKACAYNIERLALLHMEAGAAAVQNSFQ
jgi:hypothetical protein